MFGHNTGQKQDINLGKRTNQNFVNIPFTQLIHMLEYKCRVNGIHFIVHEESHTSKCSFIDQESIDITKTTLEDVLNEVSLSPCLVRNTIRMLTAV